MLITSSYVVLFLPLPVALLSGWFCHERLPAAFNALISLFITFGVAVLYVRLAGPIIGGQIISLLLITAYCCSLIAWPLSSLHKWFMVHMASPFAALATFKIVVQREGEQSLQPPVQWQPTPLPPVHEDYHGADTTPEIAAPPPRLPSRPLQQPIVLPSSPYQERTGV